MIRLIAILILTGCAPAIEHWRAAPEYRIVIPAPPPRPPTFFERTFPHAEDPWPSNKVPMQTPWRQPPLQVV